MGVVAPHRRKQRQKQGGKQDSNQPRILAVLVPGAPLPLDERRQVPRRHADRVQDAHVRQLALTHQPVHGRGTHAELGGHVAHREQRASAGPAPALHHAEPPRTLQQGCSKNPAKRGYRRHALDFAPDPTSNEIARLRRRATPSYPARCPVSAFPS